MYVCIWETNTYLGVLILAYLVLVVFNWPSFFSKLTK